MSGSRATYNSQHTAAKKTPKLAPRRSRASSEALATWLAPNAQVAIEQAKAKAARRIAPRRSLRPRSKFRREMSVPPTAATKKPRKKAQESRRTPVGSAGRAARGGRLQGPASSKKTGRPPAAAASTRSGRSGRSGLLSARAIRASAYEGGNHCGSAGEKAAASRPASARKIDQSTAPDDAPGPEGGTASKRIRRPKGSSSTPTMPLVVGGGSLSVTATIPESSPRKRSGMSWPRLCRYQK